MVFEFEEDGLCLGEYKINRGFEMKRAWFFRLK
jgi:hypothetical protein